MFDDLHALLTDVPLYQKSSADLWNGLYLSKQLLKAHLDATSEGASRPLAFIDDSVAWIKKEVPPTTFPKLLDLGCGPGIYAERFFVHGYQVTGVDFSTRSIAYAKNSAAEKNLAITYYEQNYLELDLDEKFDLITMIYCDYGALSTAERKTLREIVVQHLNPGGKFLLDVFSQHKYATIAESQTWENSKGGGFWAEEAYVALTKVKKYLPNILLEQTAVVTATSTQTYHIWSTYFTAQSLMEEFADASFINLKLFSDVAGTPYQESSNTLAILLGS